MPAAARVPSWRRARSKRETLESARCAGTCQQRPGAGELGGRGGDVRELVGQHRLEQGEPGVPPRRVEQPLLQLVHPRARDVHGVSVATELPGRGTQHSPGGEGVQRHLDPGLGTVVGDGLGRGVQAADEGGEAGGSAPIEDDERLVQRDDERDPRRRQTPVHAGRRAPFLPPRARSDQPAQRRARCVLDVVHPAHGARAARRGVGACECGFRATLLRESRIRTEASEQRRRGYDRPQAGTAAPTGSALDVSAPSWAATIS